MNKQRVPRVDLVLFLLVRFTGFAGPPCASRICRVQEHTHHDGSPVKRSLWQQSSTDRQTFVSENRDLRDETFRERNRENANRKRGSNSYPKGRPDTNTWCVTKGRKSSKLKAYHKQTFDKLAYSRQNYGDHKTNERTCSP
jgi:hypothetical protein